MKIRLAASALVLASSPIFAHDFWIQPARYSVVAGAPAALTFQVGHGAARQRWGFGASRIVQLEGFSSAGRRDLKSHIQGPRAAADILTRLVPPGIHVVALQSTEARSELPAGKFLDYAREEGLTPILVARQRMANPGAPGRERYSRRAKSLILVGGAVANPGFATRPVGLKLEIVPERNPYALGASRMLPVKILYRGRPLTGATVKLHNLASDEKPLATAKSDRSGSASFRIPASGNWLITTVWSEPVRGDPTTDFDTVFSSLTFGNAPPQGR